MALIGGVRLANALTSGNISGSCLQTLLGTASRNADFETLLQSPSYSCYLGTSNAASSALVNSNLAHDMIATANIGGAVLYSSPDFANNFANSTCAFQKLMCDNNVFRFFSTSPVSITCAFGNSNSVFNTTVVQSNTYVCRIISNSTLRTCLFTTEGSVDALASNPNTVASLYSDSYVAPLFLACGTSVQYAFDNVPWVDVGKGGDSVRFLTCGQIAPYIGSSPVSACCYLLNACAANTLVFVSQDSIRPCCMCGTTGLYQLNCGFGNFVCGCGYYSFCSSPYVLRCLNCLLGCGANVALLNEISTNKAPYFFRPFRWCHSLMTKFANPCTCFYGGYCNANTDGLLAANWYPFTIASTSQYDQIFYGSQYFDILNCRMTVGGNCPIVGIKAYSLQNLTVCTANTTAVTPPLCNCAVCGCRPLTEDEVRRRMNNMFNAIQSTGRSCTFTSANNGNFILFGLGFKNHHLDFGVNCVMGCLGATEIGDGTIIQHCCHCSLKTCGLLLCPMLYTKNAGGKWDIVCVCIPNTIYDCRSCGISGGGTAGCGLLDHWCRHTNNCGFLTTCITSSFACENSIWVGFVIRSYKSPCTGEITGYVYGCVAANNDPVWLCWNANCGSIPQTMFNYCCGWFTGFGPGIIHRCSDASPGTLLTPPVPRSWTHTTTANCGFYAWNFIVGKIDHSTGLKSMNPSCNNAGGNSGMVDMSVNALVYCAGCWRWLYCGFGENQQLGPNGYLPHYEIMECANCYWGPMPFSCNPCFAGAPSTRSAIMCCYACGNRARIWLFNYDPSWYVTNGCLYGCGSSFGSCRTIIQSLSVDVCGDNAYFYSCRHYPAVGLVCEFNSLCSLGSACAIPAILPSVLPPAATFALANTLMWISGDALLNRQSPPGCAWAQYYSRSRYCECYTQPQDGAVADFYQGFDDRMSSCFAFTGCAACGGIIVLTHLHAGGLNSDCCGVNCGCGLIGNQCAAGRGANHGVNWIDYTAGGTCYGLDQLWWLSRVNHTVINPERCTFLSLFFCNYPNSPFELSCYHHAIALPPNDFMANTCFCTILLRGCHSHIKVGQGASCFGFTCNGRNTRPLMYLGTGSESGFMNAAFGWDLDGFSFCCISHANFTMSCSLRTMGGPAVAFCNFMQIPFQGAPIAGIIGGYPNINCRLQLAVSGNPIGTTTIYCDHVRCAHHGIIPWRGRCWCQCLGTTAGGLQTEGWSGTGSGVSIRWLCKPTYFPGANNSPMIYSLFQYSSASFAEFACTTRYANGTPCYLGSCCSASYVWNIIKLDEVFIQACGFCCGV